MLCCITFARRIREFAILHKRIINHLMRGQVCPHLPLDSNTGNERMPYCFVQMAWFPVESAETPHLQCLVPLKLKSLHFNLNVLPTCTALKPSTMYTSSSIHTRQDLELKAGGTHVTLSLRAEVAMSLVGTSPKLVRAIHRYREYISALPYLQHLQASVAP